MDCLIVSCIRIKVANFNAFDDVGWDSSVGIATRYGLDGPGIESRCRREFPHLSRPPWGLPSLLYNGYRRIPRGKAAGAWC